VVRSVGYDALFAQHDAELAYVVGTHHEEVVHRSVVGQGGGACFVEPGLLKVKLPLGLAHPLVRAVRGALADKSGAAGDDVETLFDCTMGLAHDTVHLATVLPALRIEGSEKSPLLHALLEDGLVRLGVSARVSVACGDALDALRARADHSVDVVMLDPMMSRPKRATPPFEALRAVAWPERASPALLTEAARVARRRVVLKLGKGAPLPPGCPLVFPREHAQRGAHVTYHVAEHGAART
jgi:hypothetical protein